MVRDCSRMADDSEVIATLPVTGKASFRWADLSSKTRVVQTDTKHVTRGYRTIRAPEEFLSFASL